MRSGIYSFVTHEAVGRVDHHLICFSWVGVQTSELLDIPRLEGIVVVNAPHLIPLLVCDIQVEAKTEDRARAVLAVVALGPRIDAVAWRVMIEPCT